jgi:hypothetical protein
MMATFTDPSAFAAHIAGYSAKLERGTPDAVKTAADTAATIIRSNGARFHIKGRTGRPFKLSAKVDGPHGYGGAFYAYVKADPAGFWKLIQEGAKPHVIKPRRRGRRGADTKRALLIPSLGYFAKVNHPGTGQIGDPWGISMRQVARIVPPAFERDIASIFGRAA